MRGYLDNRFDYLKKVKEIESRSFIDESDIQDLLITLMESEDIREYSDWKNCYSAHYRLDDLYLRISIHYPENKLGMEDEELTNYKLPNENERFEVLKKEVLKESSKINSQMRRSVNRYLVSKLEEPKDSTKDSSNLSGRDEMVSFLRDNFFIPLNNFLISKNLIPVDIAYVEYSQAYKDDEGYTYPELLHFNVNNWSTLKLSLNTFGKIHNEGTSLSNKGLDLEYIMSLIISENMDWVSAMGEESFNNLKSREKEVQMKSRDSVIYTMNI